VTFHQAAYLIKPVDNIAISNHGFGVYVERVEEQDTQNTFLASKKNGAQSLVPKPTHIRLVLFDTAQDSPIDEAEKSMKFSDEINKIKGTSISGKNLFDIVDIIKRDFPEVKVELLFMVPVAVQQPGNSKETWQPLLQVDGETCKERTLLALEILMREGLEEVVQGPMQEVMHDQNKLEGMQGPQQLSRVVEISTGTEAIAPWAREVKLNVGEAAFERNRTTSLDTLSKKLSEHGKKFTTMGFEFHHHQKDSEPSARVLTAVSYLPQFSRFVSDVAFPSEIRAKEKEAQEDQKSNGKQLEKQTFERQFDFFSAYLTDEQKTKMFKSEDYKHPQKDQIVMIGIPRQQTPQEWFRQS
jgi:hypothetical protein